MPFPICLHHAAELYAAINERIRWPEQTPATKLARDQARIERAKRQHAQSVVYYARIGDAIKIGVTQNLTERLVGLRIQRPAILATEPGTFETEKIRHRQFAHLRLGRTENFRPEPDLLAHVDAILVRHGAPTFTTYVR